MRLSRFGTLAGSRASGRGASCSAPGTLVGSQARFGMPCLAFQARASRSQPYPPPPPPRSNISNVVILSNIIVLAIVLGVFSFITFLIMLPAINDVLREQRVVYDVFAVIPIRLVRKMRDDLSDEIIAARNQLNGVEEEEDVLLIGKGPEGPSKPLRNSIVFSSMQPSRSIKEATEIEETDEKENKQKETKCSRWCKCCKWGEVGVGSWATTSLRKVKPDLKETSALHASALGKGRKYRHITSGKALITIRMLWPLVLFSIYFIGVFVWRQDFAGYAINARAETLWGAGLEVLAPSVAYSLRNAVVYTERDVWVPKWIEKTQTQIDLMVSLVDDLAYGSETRFTRSGLVTSPAMYRLLLEVSPPGSEANRGTLCTLRALTPPPPPAERLRKE